MPDPVVSAPQRVSAVPDQIEFTPSMHASTRQPAPPPTMVSLAVPGISFVVGRLIVALAIVSACRLMSVETGVGRSAMARPFDLAIVAAMLLGGLAASAYFASVVSGGARRFRLRASRGGVAAVSWLLPVAWVVAGSTLLTVRVDAEVDPMPFLAIAGLLAALAVPYVLLTDATRRLDRGPALSRTWTALYVLDVVALGAVWLAAVDHFRHDAVPGWAVTAAEVGALASIVAVFVSVAIAARLPRLFRQRLDQLERGWLEAVSPAWFRTGFAGAGPMRRSASLVDVTWARRSVVATLAAGAVTTFAEATASWAPLPFSGVGNERLLTVASLSSFVAAGCCAVAFGVWSFIVAVNGRRERPLGSVPPGLFALLALPAPVLLIVMAVVGGPVGWMFAPAVVTLGGLSAVIALKALGVVVVNLRGPATHLMPWLLVTFLATVAVGARYLAVGTATTDWYDLGLEHALVAADGLALAAAALVGRRTMAGMPERLQLPVEA